jgi:hypothetical protein
MHKAERLPVRKRTPPAPGRRRLKPRLGASADATKPACAGSPQPWHARRLFLVGNVSPNAGGESLKRDLVASADAPRRGFNRLRPGAGGVLFRVS